MVPPTDTSAPEIIAISCGSSYSPTRKWDSRERASGDSRGDGKEIVSKGEYETEGGN